MLWPFCVWRRNEGRKIKGNALKLRNRRFTNRHTEVENRSNYDDHRRELAAPFCNDSYDNKTN